MDTLIIMYGFFCITWILIGVMAWIVYYSLNRRLKQIQGKHEAIYAHFAQRFCNEQGTKIGQVTTRNMDDIHSLGYSLPNSEAILVNWLTDYFDRILKDRFKDTEGIILTRPKPIADVPQVG